MKFEDAAEAVKTIDKADAFTRIIILSGGSAVSLRCKDIEDVALIRAQMLLMISARNGPESAIAVSDIYDIIFLCDPRPREEEGSE